MRGHRSDGSCSPKSPQALAPTAAEGPFIPQDVFRLVVRLEAQKAIGDVDVAALERKFRVPTGYSEEDLVRKQEKFDLENLPGPGAYDVEDPWRLEHHTRAREGISLEELCQKVPSSANYSPVRSLLSAQSAVFAHTPKQKASFLSLPTATTSAIGPGVYDAPSSALFGASHAKREVTWSPARNPPSYAVPEAWNASSHYAKQKSRVLRAAERDKKLKNRTNEWPVTTGVAHSESSPAFASLISTHPDSDNAGGGALDPFEWLRRQPQGEQRANHLATKFGLLEQVKPLSHDATEDSASLSPARPVLVSKSSSHDLQGLLNSSTPPSPIDGESVAGKDARIVVSCRLPGGMLLSTTLFSRKKVRHLKAWIAHSQTRFPRDDQFDLFLPSGRKLAPLDATLQSCGLSTRSLVQVVPSAATLSPLPTPS
ncbi:hypothetical protein PybrP1_003382 [[Pythium] brassicae (nom. inval.)]|nr:hypothetical protein PybrP1_003382 [[Pythium] brassicae (nom. inval.)]